MTDTFSFDLWTQPWITVEQPDGGMTVLSIEQTLLHAQNYRAIYDASPLVIVGVHRLLTAILQSIIDPQKAKDLRELWEAGRFPADKIAEFSKSYGKRFDLFSQDAPFMQSADLPRKMDKKLKADCKSVSYLAADIPSGVNVTHFKHGSEDDRVFCPVCAAKGIICLSAFATFVRPKIEASINGIPPIYVLPVGNSLFDSLARSLLCEIHKPKTASKDKDLVWWNRESLVQKYSQINQLGYLHSLTFPVRRIRLHEPFESCKCSLCGQIHNYGVRHMTFEMGEAISRDMAAWFDPFVAYRINKDGAITVKPTSGKSVWRDFHNLFLQGFNDNPKVQLLRPAVIEQIYAVMGSEGDSSLSFRCIGMQTGFGVKRSIVYEWIDSSFDVPLSLLIDHAGGAHVGRAVAFAEDCAVETFTKFKSAFGSSGERFESLRQRMRERYWKVLSAPFREFVLKLGGATDRNDVLNEWIAMVMRTAFDEFKVAASQVGDDAVSLRQRVHGEAECRKALGGVRKRYLPESEAETVARAAREGQRASKKRTNQTRSK